MLVNLLTDLHIKANSTKRIKEHVKPCSENSDLIINTCVDRCVSHGTNKMREDQRRPFLEQRQRLFWVKLSFLKHILLSSISSDVTGAVWKSLEKSGRSKQTQTPYPEPCTRSKESGLIKTEAGKFICAQRKKSICHRRRIEMGIIALSGMLPDGDSDPRWWANKCFVTLVHILKNHRYLSDQFSLCRSVLNNLGNFLSRLKEKCETSNVLLCILVDIA